MAAKLKTVHITLTPQIAELLEAEVAAGRFANLSEAVRNAAWKAFAEDPAAELRAAFSQLDESPEDTAPSGAEIASEIRSWRAQRPGPAGFKKAFRHRDTLAGTIHRAP